MRIRENINKHPVLKIGLSVAFAAVAVVYVAYQLAGSAAPPKPMAFYTDDDGASLFSDELEKIPPFDHNGRTAVRAFVFTCDEGQHRFVQYLQKYSDPVKQQMESGHLRNEVMLALIKRPGPGDWIAESDPKAARITERKCPDGMGAGPFRQVLP